MKKYLQSLNYNSNKGITLLALIVTVIILMILAGITIGMLMGNNGLLNKATNAKNASESAREVEELKAEVQGSYNKSGDLIISTLKTNIQNNINGATTDNASSFPLIVTYTATGNRYKVNEDGDIIQPTVLKVGNTDLSTVSDISTMYGQITDYKSKKHPDIKWQLFYVDSSNYYLIASDYVPNAELPCNGNTGFGATDLIKSTESGQRGTFCAKFVSSESLNDGVLTAGTIYKNGSSSTAITNNPLTSTYLKWANTYNTSTNNNICIAAYIMDTSKWSSFADGASGAYAMGGPTIEMFVLSYNTSSRHTTKFGTYEEINSNNSHSMGYKIQFGANTSWTSYITGIETSGLDTMWVKSSQTKAYGYWLASPSYGGTNYVYGVSYFAGISDCDAYANTVGFRPIVAIPKF